MGYRKIANFYKDNRILMFKECYCLEKIHGTSAHIKFKEGRLIFYSGGASMELFVSLFDKESLMQSFMEIGRENITVYGEAYGGKMQGMRATYGDSLQFIAFEVALDGDIWLNVDSAKEVADKLGLRFVAYERGPATIEWINSQRDLPSSEALRLGLGEHKREGVVVRPIEEYRDPSGGRIIHKHKREDFSEHRIKREVITDPEKLIVVREANKVAFDWVTPMRLAHVLDKLPGCTDVEHIPIVIKAMISDIEIEGEGEIAWGSETRKAISRETVSLFKKHIGMMEVHK